MTLLTKILSVFFGIVFVFILVAIVLEVLIFGDRPDYDYFYGDDK